MFLSASEALALAGARFDEISGSAKTTLLGVEYLCVRSDSGDELFVTSHGWPWFRQLQPENWYHNERYRIGGQRLRFSTGAVYRVPIPGPRPLELVLKFSRVGQHLERERLRESDAEQIDPGFSSPFEEVAHLQQLRSASNARRILTKRALGIFSPAETVPAWQLGRISHQFRMRARLLEDDQRALPTDKVVLSPDRDYLLLFQWMRGLNLEECLERGLLDGTELERINQMVLSDLRESGFEVLDHKPNHVIVRTRRDGSLLRRHGRVVYGLADFELLVLRASSDSV